MSVPSLPVLAGKLLPRLLFALLMLWIRPAAAGDGDDGKGIVRERPAATKWGLLIGVNDYIHARNLTYCSRDVEALRERLVGLGFPERQVYLLHDGAAERKNEPYKSNIDAAIELLLGKLSADGAKLERPGLVGAGDMVVVALSGHGVHLEGVSYFCPVDARLDRPTSLLSLTKLYRLLELSAADVKLLLVDACRNDPRTDGEKTFGPTEGSDRLARSLLSPPRGILVLSSCAPGQVSLEDEDLRHGVFLHYVLEGLAGAADREEGNRNHQVSLLELYRYVSRRTDAFVSEKRRMRQTPELRGEIVGDFEFGPISVPLPLLTAPAASSELRAAQEGWSAARGFPVTIQNSLEMSFLLVPPGEFEMGSPAGEEHRQADEHQHRVRLTRPYWLAATEVTQSQWRSVFGGNPSWFAPGAGGEARIDAETASRLPVESVTWEEAVEFCRRLSSISAEREAGRRYRLPTEAEWEYAARLCPAPREAAFPEEFVWNRSTAGDAPRPVASLAANGLGLFDLGGNVSEWCSDWYAADYYRQSPLEDPPGAARAESDGRRVLRGGNWLSSEKLCRPAYRGAAAPDTRQNTDGLRLVLEFEPR